MSTGPDDYTINMTRSDGAIMELSRNQIHHIEDNQGNDITDLLFPNYSPLPNSPNQPPPSSVARPTYDEFGTGGDPEVVPGGWVFQESEPPQLFDAMIVAGVGYSAPKGEFYDGFESGLLYFGEVCVSFTPRKYMRVGYRSMRSRDDTIHFYDYETESNVSVNFTVDIRQYTITAGTLSRPNNRNKLRAYGEFGIAFVEHIFKSSGYSYYTSNASETRLLVLGKGGLLIPFKDKFGLDLGVSMGTKLFGGNGNEGIGFLFDIHAGLMVQFGGD